MVLHVCWTPTPISVANDHRWWDLESSTLPGSKRGKRVYNTETIIMLQCSGKKHQTAICFSGSWEVLLALFFSNKQTSIHQTWFFLKPWNYLSLVGHKMHKPLMEGQSNLPVCSLATVLLSFSWCGRWGGQACLQFSKCESCEHFELAAMLLLFRSNFCLFPFSSSENRQRCT